jgi:multidrug efflux pump subunit AcrB
MITLVASLLVAYVINPVFAVTFMKRDDEIKRYSLKGFLIILVGMLVVMALSYLAGARTMGNIMLIGSILYTVNRFILGPSIRGFQQKVIPAMLNRYRKILRWCLKGRRPYMVIVVTIGMFIFSFVLLGMYPPKVVFFPETDPNFIYVFNELPIGTNVEKTKEVTKELEKRVYAVLGKENPAVKSIITNVSIGAGDQNDFNKANPIPHKSRIQIEFVEFKERNGVSTAQYLKEMRAAMKGKGLEDATITVEKESSGPPTAKPVNIEIKGDEITALIDVAQELKEFLSKQIEAGGRAFPGSGSARRSILPLGVRGSDSTNMKSDGIM